MIGSWTHNRCISIYPFTPKSIGVDHQNTFRDLTERLPLDEDEAVASNGGVMFFIIFYSLLLSFRSKSTTLSDVQTPFFILHLHPLSSPPSEITHQEPFVLSFVTCRSHRSSISPFSSTNKKTESSTKIFLFPFDKPQHTTNFITFVLSTFLLIWFLMALSYRWGGEKKIRGFFS